MADFSQIMTQISRLKSQRKSTRSTYSIHSGYLVFIKIFFGVHWLLILINSILCPVNFEFRAYYWNFVWSSIEFTIIFKLSPNLLLMFQSLKLLQLKNTHKINYSHKWVKLVWMGIWYTKKKKWNFFHNVNFDWMLFQSRVKQFE